MLWGRRSSLKKLAELLALLLIVWRVPANIGWFAFKQVWHENLIWLLLITVGKNIGALNGLREVAKDVVNYEDSLLRI